MPPPPRKKNEETIPVFLAADDIFAPFAAAAIASICYNTASFVEFYVLDGGITAFHRRQIETLRERFANFSIEFIIIDVDKEFKDFTWHPETGITLSCYSRLLIPLLKPKIKRALYSDVDVIALGDIAEFYRQNLRGKALGAVYHHFWAGNPLQIKQTRMRLDLSAAHRYFYAGNLLIDCEQWRRRGIVERCFAIEQQYRSHITMQDQDVLNKCFDNNEYEELALKFCATSHEFAYFRRNDDAAYKRLTQETVIRHFVGRAKPWLTDRHAGLPLDNFGDFWFFAAMTPFYAGLWASYVASRARNEEFSCEIIGNIKKPDTKMLADLRARMVKK